MLKGAVVFGTVLGFSAVLFGCGGSSSSGGSGSPSPTPSAGSTIAEQRVEANCSDTPTSTGAYDINSYHACGDEEGGISGLWMLVADYQVSSLLQPSFEGQLRMGFRIDEGESGELTITSCPGLSSSPSQIIISSAENDAEQIELTDPMTGATILLDVVDALHLEGEHQSDGLIGQYTVARSAVSARKLTEDTSLQFGATDLEVQLGDENVMASGAAVPCFVHALGESVQPGSIIPRSEIITVFSDVGDESSPQYVSVNTLVAQDTDDDGEPIDDFEAYQAVEVYLSATEFVSSDEMDGTEIEYLSNNNVSIEQEIVVEDEDDANDFASSSSSLSF